MKLPTQGISRTAIHNTNSGSKKTTQSISDQDVKGFNEKMKSSERGYGDSIDALGTNASEAFKKIGDPKYKEAALTNLAKLTTVTPRDTKEANSIYESLDQVANSISEMKPGPDKDAANEILKEATNEINSKVESFCTHNMEDVEQDIKDNTSSYMECMGSIIGTIGNFGLGAIMSFEGIFDVLGTHTVNVAVKREMYNSDIFDVYNSNKDEDFMDARATNFEGLTKNTFTGMISNKAAELTGTQGLNVTTLAEKLESKSEALDRRDVLIALQQKIQNHRLD